MVDTYALHEAMQQQTISVAKARVIMILNVKTAVLAAANPKLGRFNQYQSIDFQLTLPVTILSRFDLIFLVTDTESSQLDKKSHRSCL